MSSPNSVESALQLFVRYLREQQANGRDQAWLTPQARKTLAELPGIFELATGEISGSPAATTPEPKPASATQSPEAAAQPPETVQPRTQETPQDFPVELTPVGQTTEEKLRWLAEKARTWPPAKALASLRDRMVFATGNPHADLMFIGEAPGAEEERWGEPFVGPAGRLLTKMLGAMGLKREEVYISNIVKFRPAVPNQGQSNRKPTPEEMASCLDFVRVEINLVRPKVIVALGGTAAEGLLGCSEPVGKLRNRFHEFNKVPTMVTYHPSYLLRNKSLTERRKVWEDLLLVMAKMDLPISAKQRGYFKTA